MIASEFDDLLGRIERLREDLDGKRTRIEIVGHALLPAERRRLAFLREGARALDGAFRAASLLKDLTSGIEESVGGIERTEEVVRKIEEPMMDPEEAEETQADLLAKAQVDASHFLAQLVESVAAVGQGEVHRALDES